MKRNVIRFGYILSLLTLVGCQNLTGDAYISPCEKALKRGSKAFHNKYDDGDKARATGLCTCRSRGLQSVLSVEDYDGLIRATKAGKTKMFRVIEQKYFTDLTSTNPSLGKPLTTVTVVCRKYGVEVKNSVYRKKALPALPY